MNSEMKIGPPLFTRDSPIRDPMQEMKGLRVLELKGR
jgi:hypothetical protein